MNAQSPCTRLFMTPHAHSLLSKFQTLIIAKCVVMIVYLPRLSATLDDPPVHQGLGHGSSLLREDLAVPDNAGVSNCLGALSIALPLYWSVGEDGLETF